MKKNLLTRLTLMTCAFSFLNLSSVAYAKTTQSVDALKASIQQKSAHEFDQYMMEYMKNEQANKKSLNEMKKDLKSIGVELVNYKKTSISKSNSSTNKNSNIIKPATTTYPSDVTISSYIAKRAADPYYSIYSEVDDVNTLYNCGSLDLLSVEWNPSYFTFYSYGSAYNSSNGSSTSFISLFDTSKRSSGIILFNVEDKRMYAGDSVCGVAYVKVNKSGSSEFQAKYIHTYDDSSINWTVGGNVGYSQKDGWNGGATFTISPSSSTKSWQVEDINGTV